MKTFLALITFGACAVAGASEEKSRDAFLTFKPAGAIPFGRVDAQASADAQRIAIYGLCGMSFLKEKKGAFWIFETRVGYGALPKPDIFVAEPSTALPSFGPQQEEPKKPSQPMPLGRRG